MIGVSGGLGHFAAILAGDCVYLVVALLHCFMHIACYRERCLVLLFVLQCSQGCSVYGCPHSEMLGASRCNIKGWPRADRISFRAIVQY